MRGDDAVRKAILEEISHGSMSKETIVSAVPDEYSEREVKMAFVGLLNDGSIEEHPEFEGAYRATE